MKTKKLPIMLLFGVLMALLFASCATILTGTTDKIKFTSDPPGAIVYIDGVEQGVTPCKVKVSRTINDKEAVMKLDGYETRLITLNKKFNLVSIINLGDPLGWAVDIVTGAIIKYDQKEYNIILFEDAYVSAQNPAKVEIDTREKTVDLYVIEE